MSVKNIFENIIQSFFSLSNISIILILSILIIIYLFYRFITFTEIINGNEKFQCSGSCSENAVYKDEPPDYPNGWIPVIESRKLKPKSVVPIKAFGHEMVAFRGSSGKAYVLDAYCPHLGAHIGYGGKVVNCKDDDCVKCPFHGWTFRGRDGLCVDIPYSQNPLPNTHIKVWKSIEVNHILFVWFHCDDLDPQWFPLRIPQIEKSQWIYRGRSEHYVNCNFQEIPENGPDFAHLSVVHDANVFLGSDMKTIQKYSMISRIIKHRWTSSWEPCPSPNEHMTKMTLSTDVIIFGYKLFTLDFEIEQIGPACVHLELKTTFLGGINGCFIQFITPLGPRKQRIVNHIYVDPSFKSLIFSKFLLFGESVMHERDIKIWDKKRFVKYPKVTKEEKSLVKYRRWFKQFYSENSNLKNSLNW